MTQDQALNILKTGANVFLTGEPGAGKSYTINKYVEYLKSHDVYPSITASTGIAATHIAGMTIHSWSGVGIKDSLTDYELDAIVEKEYLNKRIVKAKIIIIDEVSMLRPEVLEMVDKICKGIRRNHEPFGGLQVVLVGDFFQLPPIKKMVFSNYDADVDSGETGFFADEDFEKKPKNFVFQSDIWDELNLVTCYITEQHRQEDDKFLTILNSIRKNEIVRETHNILTSRISKDISKIENATKLYSHNLNVDKVNDMELLKITGSSKTYTMSTSGKGPLIESLKKSCMSPEILNIKIGAKVMFTKNNSFKNYMNGTLGVVTRFQSDVPVVRVLSGEEIVAESMDWTVEDEGKIKAMISQIPLRHAWAITIHKSQGMSLDSAIMDLSKVFEYGQGYVALSRVRKLEGLHLVGYNEKSLEVHPEVLAVDESMRQNSEEAEETFGDLTEDELQKMHDNFILANGGKLEASAYVADGIKEKKLKVDTVEETYKLWQKMGPKEISLERKLTLNTIMDHIQKIAQKPIFDVSKGMLESLNGMLDTKALKAIQKGISSISDPEKAKSLKYVFEVLKHKYSYEEIRVAIAVQEFENANLSQGKAKTSSADSEPF